MLFTNSHKIRLLYSKAQQPPLQILKTVFRKRIVLIFRLSPAENRNFTVFQHDLRRIATADVSRKNRRGKRRIHALRKKATENPRAVCGSTVVGGSGQCVGGFVRDVQRNTKIGQARRGVFQKRADDASLCVRIKRMKGNNCVKPTEQLRREHT